MKQNPSPRVKSRPPLMGEKKGIKSANFCAEKNRQSIMTCDGCRKDSWKGGVVACWNVKRLSCSEINPSGGRKRYQGFVKGR